MGAGFGFSFRRVYRSDSENDTVLGFGWSHSLEQYLTPDGNDLLRFDGATGTTWRYTWDAEAQAFVSPPGFYDRLAVEQDGTRTITDRHGVVSVYTLVGGLYRLTERRDRNQNTLLLAYDQSRLTGVTDSHSRTVTFQYTPEGRLAAFTDFYDPVAPRVYSFSYTAEGDLASCSGPLGSLQSYTYAKEQPQAWLNHNLREIRDDLGRVFVAVTYDEQTDRVTAQQFGDATQVYRFAYAPVVPEGWIQLTDRRGDGVWTCSRDAAGRFLTRHLLAPSIDSTWIYTFNNEGEITSRSLPARQRDDWLFDEANPEPRRRGDLLEHRKLGFTDVPDLVESWTYLAGVPWSLRKTFTNGAGRTTTYFYDEEEATGGDLNGDGRTDQAAGQLVKIAHPTVTLGVTTPQTIEEKLWYDARGRLLRRVDPQNRATVYEYFTAGPEAGYMARTIEDAGGLDLTTSWTVDRVGNTLTETSPRQVTTSYEVDRADRVTRVNGPLGYTTETTYQGLRMASTRVKNLLGDGQQDPGLPWIVTDYTHTLLGEVATETRSVTGTATATTTYTRDAEQNVREIAHPTGRRDTFEHDARHLPTGVTQGAGSASAVVRNLWYDDNGFKTLEGWASGNMAFGYDVFTRPTGTAMGKYLAKLSYDPPDEPMPGAEEECCESGGGCGGNGGTPLPEVGAWYAETSQIEEGNGIHCEYPGFVLMRRTNVDRDELGRVYAERRLHQDAAGNPLAGGESIIRRELNAAGRAVRIVPPVGSSASSSFDTAGRLTESKDRETGGNRTSLTLDADGDATRTVRTLRNEVTGQDETLAVDRVYDAYRRATSTTLDPGGANRTSTLKHDSRGNVVEAVDAGGNRVRRTFDGLGNVRTIIYEPVDAPSITLTMEYDAGGTMTSITDGMGHTTTYVLDALSRVVRIVYADATEELLEYDASGRVWRHTDPNGTRVETMFNVADLPIYRAITRATGVLGPTEEWLSYDAMFRLTSVQGELGSTTLAYTSLDQVEKITPFIGAGTFFTGTTSFQFDAAANRTRMTYLTGRTLDLSPDDLGRLSTIQEGATTLAQFQYSGGDLVRRTYGNGSVLRVTRDGLGQTLEVRHEDAAGALRAGFGYAHDELGRRKYRSRLHDGVGDAYRHDGLGQLTGVKAGVPAADLAPQKAYGDYATFGSQRAYDLDAAGNRRSVETDGVVSHYNFVNGVNVPDLMNRYRSIDAATRVHDANGNLKDDGTFTYAYNYRNQLVEARRKSDGVLVARFVYDPLGRRERSYRLQAGVQVGWTDFFYDGADVIAERDEAGTFLATHVNGPGIDHLLSTDRGAQRYFYHEDALGSICLVTNAAGANVERYDYTEYGMPTVSPWDPQANGGAGGWGAGVVGGASAICNTRMFTAREWDAELGLYCYRARHYDPKSGRFLQVDPARESTNAYTYVGNRPTGAADPTGRTIEINDSCDESLATYLRDQGIPYSKPRSGHFKSEAGTPPAVGNTDREILWRMLVSPRAFTFSNVDRVKEHVNLRLSIVKSSATWAGGYRFEFSGPACWRDEDQELIWTGSLVDALRAWRDMGSGAKTGCRNNAYLMALGGLLGTTWLQEYQSNPTGRMTIEQVFLSLFIESVPTADDDWVPGDRGWIKFTGTALHAGDEGQNLIYLGGGYETGAAFNKGPIGFAGTAGEAGVSVHSLALWMRNAGHGNPDASRLDTARWSLRTR